MGPKAKKVLAEALELSDEERADLASALLESLNREPGDEGVEEAWSDEIKRRVEEVESGAVKTVPWEEVDEKLGRIIESRKRS